MAALSAVTMGASKVMVVDRHPDRLRLAEQVGAIPVDAREEGWTKVVLHPGQPT
jgi:threonine dehydrogenase-like Zn-dependent dehydrogenase